MINCVKIIDDAEKKKRISYGAKSMAGNAVSIFE